ncbi:MAG TPA: hypothetical protein VL977_00510 [Solirubrobacteraceae bacterium]|nr:hypothetical protein [Solirubrobacteraceae bacterium]
MAGLALAPAAAGKVHGIVPPRNPAANVAPSPNYDNCQSDGYCVDEPPCYAPGSFAAQFSSPDCVDAEVQAIDNARAKEGVGPMYLPSDYASLTAQEQLLVVIDLERVGRGLPPIAGIVASMDGVAQKGTQVAGAPAGTFEDPAFPGGFQIGAGARFAWRCHGSASGFSCDGSGQPGAAIAAGGDINALDADYGWMYDDGPGGSNFDCRTPTASGCWGHRDNILGRYPTRSAFTSGAWGSSLAAGAKRRTTLVMGAGALQPDGAGGPQGNFTAIFAAVVGRARLVYTWKQARAAGAGRPTG